MNIGRLFLRLVMGGFLIGHGTQKLFGWFGGSGLDSTAKSFEGLGLRPGKRNALAAGVAETGGGALLALGLETPLAASAVAGAMLTAIHRVHLKNGPWITKGGYEYNLVLIAAAVALAEVGPGDLSLDARRGSTRRGPGWAAASFVAGALGARATWLLAERNAEPESAPRPADADEPMTPEHEAEVEQTPKAA